jgi:glutathione-regulated potassium-efflux system ancillary protein KefC
MQVFSDIAVIIVISTFLAVVAVLTRQPIIIAYIIAGIALGPWGFSIVKGISFLNGASHIGVVLLLFLAGVVLHPRRLVELFKETIIITVATGFLFCTVFAFVARLFGFSILECVIVGIALMFSSTILVVKLLPTTALHQKRMGSLCIAVLIAQDIIAVAVLLILSGRRPGPALQTALIPVVGAAFIAAVMFAEQYLIRPVMRRVDYYHEVIYLMALAWCFGCAMIAQKIGFSHEIGAFIAGVSLARSPISLFLSEGLKFFRDFFLVLFFFTLGAQIDLLVVKTIIIPAIVLSALLLAIKPLGYILLFRFNGEQRRFSREIGIRLGQASEFSLIVGITAMEAHDIGQNAAQLIAVVFIITLIISSYITVFFLPTPIGSSGTLKQD